MATTIAAIISSGVALLSAVLVLLVKRKVDTMARAEDLKQRYSNPLLKSAEELHNKLNDVIRNHARVAVYLKDLKDKMEATRTFDDVLRDPATLYVFHLFYLFARYLANIEEIKRGFGILQLETPRQTRAMYRALRQTVAVFFSNRLHEGIRIRSPRLKYQGTILEGMQVMMAETMLGTAESIHKPLGFSEFCRQMTQSAEFRSVFSPLVNLLEDLSVTSVVNSDQEAVDVRWIKLVLCSYFLNRLVKTIDSAQAVSLLPETEEYIRGLLDSNPLLVTNLESFRKGYPDP